MSSLWSYKSLPWAEGCSKIYRSGRVVVGKEVTEQYRLELYNCGCINLSAQLIPAVLKNIMGENWVEELEREHLKRRHIWKSQMYINCFGEEEYRIYTLQHQKAICSSRLIVSQGQINSFSILEEDAAPLLRMVMEKYQPSLLGMGKTRRNYYLSPYLPFYTVGKSWQKLKEEMSRQQAATQKIEVQERELQNNACLAGESSGILEISEALKCMEVLLA